MKQVYNGLYVLLFLAIMASSCTDPTIIGSELLDEDRIDVGFTDTLSVFGTTTQGDTVRTYSPFLNQQLSTYLFGDMKDPLYGRIKSTVYTQPRPERFRVDFSNQILDSIVLVLPYDSIGYYGKTFETFEIDVRQVMEDMPRDEEFFSNVEFEASMNAIGTASFFPSLDSTIVVDYSQGTPDTTKVPPQLRVTLDQALVANALFNPDTAVYESDETFLEVFKGVKLIPNSENNGIIGFNLFAAESGIFVYYHDDAGEFFQYQYVLGALSVRAANYEHDYSGTLVETFIDNTDKGDSLLFVQGLEGLEAKIEIPNVEDLKGFIVNKAEMIITIAELEGDDPNLYDPPSQLILLKKNEEDDLVVIDDVVFAGAELQLIFGGNLVQGENGEPDTYTMNISSHIQRMIDGDESSELFVQPFPKGDRAWRVPLKGANAAANPVIIRLAFTRP